MRCTIPPLPSWPSRFVPVLVAPSVGVVAGPFRDRAPARVALNDRIANGEAFADEAVARLPRRLGVERHRAVMIEIHAHHIALHLSGNERYVVTAAADPKYRDLLKLTDFGRAVAQALMETERP